MIGFHDLAGDAPCARCDSDSGDCDWLRSAGRCSAACVACGGGNAGRCTFCDEVVPCGHEADRNPRPDAACAWGDLARLHAPECEWTRTRGGIERPLRLRVQPLRS